MLKGNIVSKKSKQILSTIALLFLVALMATGCGQSNDSKQSENDSKQSEVKALSWGTSSVGSAGYVISIGVGDILRKAGINIAVEAVGGSDANINALIDKKIDLGIMGNFAASNAYLGKENYSEKGKQPLRMMAQSYPSLRVLVVRKDSGIKTPADLKGKTFIGKRKALVDVEMTANAILKAYDLTPEDVKMIGTADANEAIEALKLGTADAAVIPSGIGASYLIDLANTTEVSFISIPDDKLKEILNEVGPAWFKFKLPAGTYKGQNEDVAITATNMALIARDDFSEETAYSITKNLMENPDEIKNIHSEAKYFNVEWALANPAIPFHPGAIKYFKEIKAWTPEMDNIQKELLSKGTK